MTKGRNLKLEKNYNYEINTALLILATFCIQTPTRLTMNSSRQPFSTASETDMMTCDRNYIYIYLIIQYLQAGMRCFHKASKALTMPSLSLLSL